ncbi:MAG: transglycosylase SLT domain-containing protein [Nitrospirota bacterium]|nr:transglycosylase SLT domain-containing protein [Nitrospirota bacterium]
MRIRPFYILTVTAWMACSLSPAYADIYEYVDNKGVVHFTNVPTSTNGKQHARIRSESRQQSIADAVATAPLKQPVRQEARATVGSGMPTTAYTRYINDACEKHGVDPSLVHAIVKVESDFNPFAISRKGAMGLMQLMPQTASDLNVNNSFSPRENIEGGVRYLRTLLERYEGNVPLALAAYNAGETNVKKWGTVPPFKETRDYVKKIMKLYKGGETAFAPRHTIYVGYSADGVLLLTDNPSNHQDKQLRQKTGRSL